MNATHLAPVVCEIACVPGMDWLHSWFRFWERRIPSFYRVVAVSVGALATTVGLGALTRTKWWKHAPLATAVWALLGKVEGDDTDQELAASVDPALKHLVQRQLNPILIPAGFTWNEAFRARRRDGSYDDVMLYEAEPSDFAARFPHLVHDEPPELCVDLWITINTATLRGIDLNGPIGWWLRRCGHDTVADAIEASSKDLEAGLRAVADGLRLLLVERPSA